MSMRDLMNYHIYLPLIASIGFLLAVFFTGKKLASAATDTLITKITTTCLIPK